jgi:hypothetical protein
MFERCGLFRITEILVLFEMRDKQSYVNWFQTAYFIVLYMYITDVTVLCNS